MAKAGKTGGMRAMSIRKMQGVRRACACAAALTMAGLTGCSSGPSSWNAEKVKGLATFEGEPARMRFDREGNVAIPGEFTFVQGVASYREPGWLVSASPELAAQQAQCARVLPGRGYFLDDRTGVRPVPDTWVFEGERWRVALRRDFPATEKDFAPPVAWLGECADAAFGPARVRVSYDSMLLVRRQALVAERARRREMAGEVLVAVFKVFGGVAEEAVEGAVESAVDRAVDKALDSALNRANKRDREHPKR